MTATVLTLPQTAERVLDQCRRAGVALYVENGKLLFKAEQGKLTDELRDAVRRHKAALLTLLAPEAERQADFRHAIERDDPPAAIPSGEGKALLEPFLSVIGAAHRNELPPVPLQWSRAGELNGYVCAISAGIWYGVTLSDPERLAAHLENMKRLQAWFTEQ